LHQKNANLPWKYANIISAPSGKGHVELLRTDPSVMTREGSLHYWEKQLMDENTRTAGFSPIQSSFVPLSKTAFMCFQEKTQE